MVPSRGRLPGGTTGSWILDRASSWVLPGYFLRIKSLHTWKRGCRSAVNLYFGLYSGWITTKLHVYRTLTRPMKLSPGCGMYEETPAFFETTWFRISKPSMPSNKLAGERFRLFSFIRLGRKGGGENHYIKHTHSFNGRGRSFSVSTGFWRARSLFSATLWIFFKSI